MTALCARTVTTKYPIGKKEREFELLTYLKHNLLSELRGIFYAKTKTKTN